MSQISKGSMPQMKNDGADLVDLLGDNSVRYVPDEGPGPNSPNDSAAAAAEEQKTESAKEAGHELGDYAGGNFAGQDEVLRGSVQEPDDSQPKSQLSAMQEAENGPGGPKWGEHLNQMCDSADAELAAEGEQEAGQEAGQESEQEADADAEADQGMEAGA